MIPKLQNILDELDEIAPFSFAEEWDNSGLQVGNVSNEVKMILIALDPSVNALRSAKKINAQLLLTHHPLIFKPLSQLNHEVYPGDVLTVAIQEKISIVSMHTNLDVAKNGINDMLAKLLGLQDLEVLQEGEDLPGGGIGLGRIGNLSKPKMLSSIVEDVKQVLSAQRIGTLGHKDLEINRVAVAGGSGGGMVTEASMKGADLFITGDVSHHDALQAKDLNLALIDAGHYYSERAAMVHFADFLQERFNEKGWEVKIAIYGEEEAPMRYE